MDTSCLPQGLFLRPLWASLAKMGHRQSRRSYHEVEDTLTKQDRDRGRRHDYIHRLGIRKDAPAAHSRALRQACAAQFEIPEVSMEDHKDGSSTSEGGSCSLRSDSGSSDDWAGRSREDFRVAFLSKLSYGKVWVPQAHRPPASQTVIIFDWDDTLLCTAYLHDHAQLPMTPTLAEQLKGIAAAGKKLLEMSLRLGHTFIITNAVPMWVQYSAAKYVPDLLPILEKVRVISARGRHEEQFPRDSYQWKIEAFLELQRQFDSNITTNLVSIGDSICEMDATHVMAKQFDVALIKLIKFRDNPCPLELLMQLEVIIPKFEHIVENARHMRVGLERKEGAGAVGGA